MKSLIVIIVLIDLFFSITTLKNHAKDKGEATYEDFEVIGGTLIFNMIVLAIITFVTILYMIF